MEIRFFLGGGIMPIYEYKCKKCQQIFENWQTGFEEQNVPCPVCRGSAVRVMSNTSFVLKGTGWYVTDYAGRTPSGGTSAGEKSADNAAGTSAGKIDSGSVASSPAAAS